MVLASEFSCIPVKHYLFFVDPVTRDHAQNIESYWEKAKSYQDEEGGI